MKGGGLYKFTTATFSGTGGNPDGPSLGEARGGLMEGKHLNGKTILTSLILLVVFNIGLYQQTEHIEFGQRVLEVDIREVVDMVLICEEILV